MSQPWYWSCSQGTVISGKAHSLPALPDSAPLTQLTDDALIRGIVDRDPQCLDELYGRYSGVVFSLACRIAGEASLGEEATQDVFIQVWRDGFRYDSLRGSVRAWLLTMARGRTLDRVRARQARSERLAPAEAADESDVTLCAGTPETLASASEDADTIGSVLHVLPAADRHLIDLAYFKGFTHSEIAGKLTQPLGSIKTRLRNLVKLLRAAIGEHPHPPFSWTHRPGGKPKANGGTLHGLRVLVVDDDADTLKLLTLVLRRAGASVVPASSTEQALKRLEAHWPQMMVADLEMPGQDGYDLIARARKKAESRSLRLPAVAFSAHSDHRERSKTARAGFDVHLGKPVQPSVLVTELAELARSSAR